MAIPMEQQQRPDPLHRIDGAFFWASAERGELAVQQCTGCRTLWHPPRATCPACGGMEMGEARMSGDGVVLSWGQSVHPRPFGFAEPPVAVLVELAEGPRIVSTLEGVAVDDVRAGMPVRVDFVRTSGGKAVPCFRPAGDAA